MSNEECPRCGSSYIVDGKCKSQDCECEEVLALEATIAALQSRNQTLTEALGKAEEAIKKAECRNGASSIESCFIAERIFVDHPYCGRCHSLSAISAARQAAPGTGTEGRGEGE